MRRLILIVHNVRSAHNVGSLLRTAEGLGIEKVILSGYSPYPKFRGDDRLPHLADKTDRQIHKTALGAEQTVLWEHIIDLRTYIDSLIKDGFMIAALEQTAKAVDISSFQPPAKLALIAGNEVEGLDKGLLDSTDVHLMIPMAGSKESFNVSVATSMALYQLKNAS